MFNKNIPHWSCLCKIGENTLYLVEGMNKKFPIEENSMNNLMERFSCSPDQASMFSQCDHCHQHNIPAGAFDVDFIASGSNQSSDDTEDASQHITFFTNGAEMMANWRSSSTT